MQSEVDELYKLQKEFDKNKLEAELKEQEENKQSPEQDEIKAEKSPEVKNVIKSLDLADKLGRSFKFNVK